jgi:hypothetical protein
MSDHQDFEFTDNEDLGQLMEIIDKLVLEPIAIIMEFMQDINVEVIKKSYFLCLI